MLNVVQATSLLYFKCQKVKDIPVSSGENTILSLADEIKEQGLTSVFIASSKTVNNKGMLEEFCWKLEEYGVSYVIFTDIVADPTVENVEEGVKVLNENECDCIVAVGGGSVMDCAKIISLRATNPMKSVEKMAFYLTKCQQGLPMYMVPTTSGTGSEITYFSVITDTKKQKKLAIISDSCLPERIILDFQLLRHVPRNATIYAGLDALTHSVEAFISDFHSAFLEDVKTAPTICRIIFENLPKVAENPDDKAARMKMAAAAYEAGINFRRTSVGYVHAIAHRLGETYHIPHGLACAVVMPEVLTLSYRGNGKKRLDQLAKESGLAKDGLDFVEKIREFTHSLGIESGFEQIKTEDYPMIIKRARAEAALQGCPVMFSKKEVEAILNQLRL